eukprot:m.189273 g.189273  ORF g.189273 m.189273 type:complete len:63 (-) comp16938_c1_seq48:2652-2840(-)
MPLSLVVFPDLTGQGRLPHAKPTYLCPSHLFDSRQAGSPSSFSQSYHTFALAKPSATGCFRS